jgi:hypothetical protein
MKVDVLVPVLGRPTHAAPLVASLRESFAAEAALLRQISEVRELFLCTPGDAAEISELERHGLRYSVLPGGHKPGDYARKINHGCAQSDAHWLFLGADDLRFRPGWLSACLRLHEASGALVIGTNDLGNPKVRRGQHATHSLVHRDYLVYGTIDEPDKLLHEGYHHNCVDVEFVETAMWRRMWAFASEAEVEHLHPLWKKGSYDATYALGQTEHQRDLVLLRERWGLWNHREVTLMMQRGRRQTLAGGGGRSIRIR